MSLIKHIISSLIVLCLGVSLAFATASETHTEDQKINENSESDSEFSFASNKLLASESDTGYVEYYYSYGSARYSGAILDDLYLNFTENLSYALYQSANKVYYSMATARASTVFKDSFETKIDGVMIYTTIRKYITANENADGYAPVTEEIIPTLKKLAGLLPTLADSEKWDALCFFKEAPREKNPYEGDASFGELKLVYGDESLSDDDAFVLLLLGDGFTYDERDKFVTNAEKLAKYMMNTAPYSEFSNAVKIYCQPVDSNVSGVSNDTSDEDLVSEDLMDTYFGTSFWCGGTERLVSVSTLGLLKVNSIKDFLLPKADFAGLLINSDRYGGSGGTYCTCSLNEQSPEIFIHEIAHTIADLADEYYAGDSYFGLHPNMSNQKKTVNLPWYDFYGLDGVGKYAYTDNDGVAVTAQGSYWYKPCNKTCKMEVLMNILEDGTTETVPFCPVCAEALRESMSKYSNVTNIFYQPYNRVFKADGLMYKLSAPKAAGEEYSVLDYVLIRKGENKASLSELDSSLTEIVFKNESGDIVSNALKTEGTYTVSVSFQGNDVYDAISFSFELSVEPVHTTADDFVNLVDEISAETDYNTLYTKINKALKLYEEVEKTTAVESAKTTLDAKIDEFNSYVTEANSDVTASTIAVSNIIFNCIHSVALCGLIVLIIKKLFGGKF